MAVPSSLPSLPHSPGVYLMRDIKGDIIYIGKAKDLKKRVASYFVGSKMTDPSMPRLPALVAEIRHIDYVTTHSEREALVLERKLIGDYTPVFNVMWKDDKSYPYVALTTDEDFPRLYLTREKKRRGISYFGPYPSVHGVRQLLKWAWRKKMFPLRPCRFEFTEKNPLPYSKVRHCLYLHTGECSAPCIGKISAKDYRPMVERAKWFFQGERKRLVETLRDEMKLLSKSMEYEKAADVRDQIQTLEHMNEHMTVRKLSEDELNVHIDKNRAIQELMRALHLPRPPQRIECFDISHIQGVEKVASMVSFWQGKPDKSHYRKFIIKTVEGIDDFKSMAEVVGRRYRRLKNEGLTYPDLILIDGGKGQLSSALEALMAENIKGIPIAALAKEEEELFLPGESQSVKLPLDSKGSLLVRYIRDEAHRFAITFHRLRRNKLMRSGE